MAEIETAEHEPRSGRTTRMLSAALDGVADADVWFYSHNDAAARLALTRVRQMIEARGIAIYRVDLARREIRVGIGPFSIHFPAVLVRDGALLRPSMAPTINRDPRFEQAIKTAQAAKRAVRLIIDHEAERRLDLSERRNKGSV